MTSVSIYGDGQLGRGIAAILRTRGVVDVHGPFGRLDRKAALESGADVVVIATTTRLADVVDDISTAVRSRSNVLISAEEAAFPWAVDSELADTIDSQARDHHVSVAGVGVNPGFLYDALVLTLLGVSPDGVDISVFRTVDLSGFGPTVLARIGVGLSEEEFADGVRSGRVLGHAGFPQSMAVVANAIGTTIDDIEKSLEPIVATGDIVTAKGFVISAGRSCGVEQHYTATQSGHPWFSAHFRGTVSEARANPPTNDVIELSSSGRVVSRVSVEPGIGAQTGSQHAIANSIDRIIASEPGWRTVAELVPAFPRPAS